MLYFDRLKNLEYTLDEISAIVKNPNLFIVGGSIRNILLGVENFPNDIDLTTSTTPETIRENINKEKHSCFRTEKYGTITVITKDSHPENEKIQYEITPFRAESEYTDNRHPDVVNRSDSILLDAQRRDFTINSIYYTTTPYTAEINTTNKTIHPYDMTKEGEQKIIKHLEKNGYLFFQDNNLLIVQSHKYIEKLIPQGKIDESIISYLLNTSKDFFTSTQKLPAGKKNPKKITLLIDPNKGIQNIINKKITAIGNAHKRFEEDALRIIRAVRFVSVLNEQLTQHQADKQLNLFDIQKETRIAMKKNHLLINNIAKERIKDEITKSFSKGSGFVFVSLIDELGLLPILFPAIERTRNNTQPVRYHPFDTYAHTLLTLYNLEKINKNYLVRLAMLYHDSGKPDQYAAYSDNPDKDEIRKILGGELNHRVSGPKIAKKDFGALGFSKKEIEEIMRYIAEHHTPGEILDAKGNNRVKKLRKLYSNGGFERVNNVLDITIADRRGQFNPLQKTSDITNVEELREMLYELKEKEGQFTQQQLVINGKNIMDTFSLPAGPKIGILLEKVFLRTANNIAERNKKKEQLKYIQNLLKQEQKN